MRSTIPETAPEATTTNQEHFQLCAWRYRWYFFTRWRDRDYEHHAGISPRKN